LRENSKKINKICLILRDFILVNKRQRLVKLSGLWSRKFWYSGNLAAKEKLEIVPIGKPSASCGAGAERGEPAAGGRAA